MVDIWSGCRIGYVGVKESEDECFVVELGFESWPILRMALVNSIFKSSNLRLYQWVGNILV